MNTNQNEKVRCLIIGSGPAGYTAAIYASRANLSPVLYEGIQPGGQLTTTTEVENFPGYPEGVTGTELMEDLKQQAARFGADIRIGIATETDLSAAPYKVTIDGEKVIETETLIIATGATAKYLGLPDEQKYAGMGVSACATCDGFFYRKKVVAVVGGGDTACEEALYLASLAKQVYLIVRKPYLRASKVMQERVLNAPNITVLFEHNTVGLFGEDGVEGAHLVKRMGEPDEEKVDIRLYRVIYNAIEDIQAAMKGMLDPIYEEKVLGHAEVRQIFKASGVGTIAGSYVKDGKFVRNCQVRIVRDGIVVYEGDLESLRRFKDDVKEVAAGYECGLVFKKFNDVKEGDWIEAFTMVEVPR